MTRPSNRSCKKVLKESESDFSKETGNGPLKPRPPMTAFNLFFHVERKRILEGHDNLHIPITPEYLRLAISSHEVKAKRIHQKTHGLIGFHELTSAIALRWKGLEHETRKLFENQAQLEKKKYAEQLEVWLRWHALNQADCHTQHKAIHESEFGESLPFRSCNDQKIGGNVLKPIVNQTNWPNRKNIQELNNFLRRKTSILSEPMVESTFYDHVSCDGPTNSTSSVEILQCSMVPSRIDVEIDVTRLHGIFLEIASSPIFKAASVDRVDLFEPLNSDDMESMFMEDY